jgi:hypothetical protein
MHGYGVVEWWKAGLVSNSRPEGQSRFSHLEWNDASHQSRWKGGFRAMSQSREILTRTVRDFIRSCGRNYAFPTGESQEQLNNNEEQLAASLQIGTLTDRQKIASLRAEFDWNDCYSIVTFGVRAAIFAARRSQLKLYRSGVLALCAGAPKVDWRDTLRVFAIFESCGNRLSVSFQDELRRVVCLMDEATMSDVIEDFFSRTAEMRSADALGFDEQGSGAMLTFQSRPW